MEKRVVAVGARHFGLITKAFSMIQGQKPLQLSYKIGRILDPITKLQGEFLKRISPFLDETGALRGDLTDEQRAEVEVMVNEEVEVEIPYLTVSEIIITSALGPLTVEDDSVLVYLVDIGILVDPAPEPNRSLQD